MNIQTTRPFDDDYEALPEAIKGRADKQFRLLLENPHHPSLRLKKIKGHPNIWEGRITKDDRFTFQVSSETYLLRRIGSHSILKTP
jgi:mRNA-degrading endonuclease YafQ of YafQ-DinJ toxin-antitoxin module